MKLSNDEVNRYLHTEILKECWHNYKINPVSSNWQCVICDHSVRPLRMSDYARTPTNPDYTSDDSPRSLLNAVVAMVIATVGAEIYYKHLVNSVPVQNERSMVEWLKSVPGDDIEAVKRAINRESAIRGCELLQAVTETIARACVAAHKESARGVENE